jgi:hypothetical protein
LKISSQEIFSLKSFNFKKVSHYKLHFFGAPLQAPSINLR